jgi:hypothetical protein
MDKWRQPQAIIQSREDAAHWHIGLAAFVLENHPEIVAEFRQAIVASRGLPNQT